MDMQVDKRKIAKIKKELADYGALIRCAQEFRMMGDATRLKICYLLCRHKEISVGDIANMVGVSISAVSHTLKKLHKANMVTNRREFRTVYYKISNPFFAKLLKRRIQSYETAKP